MNNVSQNDRLSTKILELLKSEIEKTDTQRKLKCMIDPLSLYLVSALQPYVLTLVALMVIIVVCQGYLTMKLFNMYKYMTERLQN